MTKAPSFKAWWTVVLLGCLFVVSFIDRMALSVLVQPVKADLGLSDVQMGLLLGGSFAFFYALFGLPLALLVDRGNRHRLVVAGVMLWSASTALGAFANGFSVLMLSRMGVGLGEAVLSPAAVSMIGDMFPRNRRAIALAIYATMGALGASGSLIVAAGVLQMVDGGISIPIAGFLEGWRATVLVISVPGFLLGMLFAASVREPARTGPPSSLPPLAEAWSHLRAHARTYAGIFGGVGLMAMVSYSAVSWYPTFLVRAYGLAPHSAGYAFGTAAMVGAVSGSFVVPLLADRLLKMGRGDGIIVTGMTCVVLIALLWIPAVLAPTFGWSIALAGPATFAIAGFGQLSGLTVQLVTPPRLRGLFTACALFIGNVVGLGLGPSLVPVLSEQLFSSATGLGQALALMTAIVTPLAFLLFLQARDPSARSLQWASAQEAATPSVQPDGRGPHAMPPSAEPILMPTGRP